MSLHSNSDLRRARPLLGTIVEISIGGLSTQKLETAVQRAFRAIEKVHDLMNFHDSQSELSRLNQQAHLKPVRVHAWTYKVLKMALAISRKTSGHFDCTRGSYREVRLFSLNRVKFLRPLSIDLSGIAKGFAVDCAVRALRKSRVRWGCINAGGDLRTFGCKTYPIHLRNPNSPQTLIPFVKLRDQAMATSGSYFSQRYPTDLSVSVIADTCIKADALTKAVLSSSDFGASFLPSLRAKAVILKSGARR